MSANTSDYNFINSGRMDHTPPYDKRLGSNNHGSGYGSIYGAGKSAATKVGITAKELSGYQWAISHEARLRLMTVGAEQYSSDTGQKFEGMPVEQLLTEAQEELLDIVNYAAMLHLRFERIKKALNG